MKTFLITGTSRGLGHELAKHYLSEGHEVIGFSRSSSTINHSRYRHFEADITDLDKVLSCLSTVKKVDVLVNSAGMASMNSLLLSAPGSLRKMLQLNVEAPAFLIQETAKIMMTAKKGRIINISTVATSLTLSGESHYIVSKAALEKLTETASRELYQFGITVNTIGLSLMQTDLIKSVPEEKINNILSGLTVKEWVKPQDVINVIDFLTADSSGQITGQQINLGGVCR